MEKDNKEELNEKRTKQIKEDNEVVVKIENLCKEYKCLIEKRQIN